MPEYICSTCQKSFNNKQNLNRHIKNSVCKKNDDEVSSISTDGNDDNLNTSDNFCSTFQKSGKSGNDTEMMILLLRQIDELKNELKSTKEENMKLQEENNLLKLREEEYKQEAIDQTIKPYSKDQLNQAVFKFNPYLKPVSMYNNGYIPKDTRGRYILKSINEIDYQNTSIKYYKKCFENILKNIPTDKLPYKIKDSSRHIFDIYDYNNNVWVKGKSSEFIRLTIKLLAGMINASLVTALSNMSTYFKVDDFNVFYQKQCNQSQFKKLKENIQTLITSTYTLPDFEMNEEEENIDAFYRKNFISSCFINRIKGNDDQETENIEYEIVPDEPVANRATENMKNEDEEEENEEYKEDYECKNILDNEDESDDEEYDTDTDMNDNSFFNIIEYEKKK